MVRHGYIGNSSPSPSARSSPTLHEPVFGLEPKLESAVPEGHQWGFLFAGSYPLPPHTHLEAVIKAVTQRECRMIQYGDLWEKSSQLTDTSMTDLGILREGKCRQALRQSLLECEALSHVHTPACRGPFSQLTVLSSPTHVMRSLIYTVHRRCA